MENTKPKPTKSDWEQNTDKLQQKEQQELDQLNTQARYNFNKKQYQQHKTQQQTKTITEPTLLDLLE